MVDPRTPVRPKTALSRTRVSAALAAAWSRVSLKLGKGAFADAIELKVRSVDRALTGDTTPELHTALNGLIADASALDEVAALPCRYRRPRAAVPRGHPADAGGRGRT